jgi:exodeoxyribonuclease-3
VQFALLQETKCLENKFPYEALEDMFYNIKVFGQKAYNGVAILSKAPIEDVVIGLDGLEDNNEARYIETIVCIKNESYRIISVYVPNGSEVGSEKFDRKLIFYNALYERIKYLLKLNENLIIGGDFNVAPDNIDVYDPKRMKGQIGFHIEERKWFRKILSLGLIDSFREFNKDTQQFTWWDYRAGSWQHNKGMRIDQILVSPRVADKITNTGVLSDTRGLIKPSDHAPAYIKM